MRKKCHQDDLEVKIEELEKVQKEITEQNAGLAAQNALLKKQLAYFEDIFAKSSLLGFEPSNKGAVNKSDLEKFQKNLLKKINKRLYQENVEVEMIEESPNNEDSLGILPNKRARNILEDGDSFSSTSISNPVNFGGDSSADRLESLRLIRSRSNSSNFSNTGYLFLAVVFCMMCCSSLLVSPSNMIKVAHQTEAFAKIISNGGSFEVSSNRKLMSAGQPSKTQIKAR
jgi:hypothetical protein